MMVVLLSTCMNVKVSSLFSSMNDVNVQLFEVRELY